MSRPPPSTTGYCRTASQAACFLTGWAQPPTPTGRHESKPPKAPSSPNIRAMLGRSRRPFEEVIMLNPTSLLADALGRNLAETYRRIYADREPHIASALDEAARLVIERIASSDALYH